MESLISLISSARMRSNSTCTSRRKPSRTRNRVGSTINRTTPVFQAIRRKRRVRNTSLRRSKDIAPSPHGLDRGIDAGPLQLAAQTIDVHLDDVGRAFPVCFPDVLA